MATGITKREQHSPDAISARNFYEDELPLPSDREEAFLTYQHKAAVLDIIRPVQRDFLRLTSKGAFEASTFPDNTFVLDDNFFALQELVQTGRKATLFYLDPPYGTGLDFHSRDLEHAYDDRMGQAAYIEFMRRRLILMRECMTDDGSIYVHIGHQMVAHLKIVMDEIFGADNFRNLITRRKCSSKNFTSKQFANLNDFVLFYTKGKNYKWNQPGIEAEEDWILKEYSRVDEFGRRYKLVPIHAPGTRNGETGMPWRDMLPPPGKHWQYVPSKLEELDKAGDMYWSSNGNPRRKVYWTADKKRTIGDYWEQYRDAHHQSIQISGYPTEKNLDMIKMIVGASSDPGDLVIDPFCGSGTTLQAARDSGRRYIGMDASFTAAKATLRRMRHGLEAMGDYVNKKRGQGEPELPFAKNGEGKKSDQECAFYVDGRLYDSYRQEIDVLASI
ncbi:adenine-specific DNA-methyltransferase [Rhizobium sp. PP-F2F-G48]|uniref:site-specific DNA-methyltransferase n=1 Tax=Rhizobium sp. PP-F2F-G48 TaxID=2135651 RepID=UPI001053FA2E|nr:site-specific DNA-methyltransferase [Rhizobium sp. PP-F2F-G48]TCM46314.1 adenine-specific DNA-methyltransferase [Rhizobium sp. PP-F2F-G48]